MTLSLAIIVFIVIVGIVVYWKPNIINYNLDLSSSKPSQNLDTIYTSMPSMSSTYPTLTPTPHRGTGVPINVPTQAGDYNAPSTQVGILTGNGEILPLMGKQLIASRDTWNFHTVSNQRNQVRLPVSYKGKSCTSEYGCDNLSNGDTVYVEGYNQAFKATIYEKQALRYIPTL